MPKKKTNDVKAEIKKIVKKKKAAQAKIDEAESESTINTH